MAKTFSGEVLRYNRSLGWSQYVTDLPGYMIFNVGLVTCVAIVKTALLVPIAWHLARLYEQRQDKRA